MDMILLGAIKCPMHYLKDLFVGLSCSKKIRMGLSSLKLSALVSLVWILVLDRFLIMVRFPVCTSNWIVHVNPVPTDGNCTGAGAHLDPANVTEAVVCNPATPENCQVTRLHEMN
jgi:hypothetical protein